MIGQLTNDGEPIGFLAVDPPNEILYSQRTAIFKVRRWREIRRTWRLDLFDDYPDWGYFDSREEHLLAEGRFEYKGRALKFVELKGAERETVLKERFPGWFPKGPLARTRFKWRRWLTLRSEPRRRGDDSHA